MDRLQKLLLVVLATGCVALASSFVDAGSDGERTQRTASGDVGTAPLADELDTEALRASNTLAATDRKPQSLARHFLMDGGAGGAGSRLSESSPDSDEPEEAGIPGAIVAVIFGIFGLLVIARRSSTR